MHRNTRRISALVVDDNDTTRAMLRAILRQNNVDVIGEAKTGEAALAMMRRQRPALVCLDVVMPGASGLDVLREIKQEFPDVRVVMVTGATDRDTVHDAIEGGADGYLLKPFNAARVMDGVRAAFAPKAAP